MEKTKEKKVEKTNESDKRSVSYEGHNESVDYSIPSWGNISERYENLWRSRLKKEGYTKGIRNTLILGILMAMISVFIMPTFSLMGAAVLFFIGTVLGSGFSGYKYGLDAFGAFHIGLLSAFILTIPGIVATTVANPVATAFFAPLMFIYIIVLSLVHSVYAGFARDAREENGKNKSHI